MKARIRSDKVVNGVRTGRYTLAAGKIEAGLPECCHCGKRNVRFGVVVFSAPAAFQCEGVFEYRLSSGNMWSLCRPCARKLRHIH